MRPDCPDALLLMAYMDGELSPEEGAPIELHLSICPECKSFLETQGTLETSWRESWQDPPDFRFNAMRKKLVPRRARHGLPGWAVGIAAGAAAVFLGIRVFQPADRSELENRMRLEAGAQEIPSGPVAPDSQALIDSVVTLSGEVPETEAEEQTEEVAAVPTIAQDGDTLGGTGGIGGTVPGEVTLATGEDALQQTLQYDEITRDLEGVAFAESTDDSYQTQEGLVTGAFSVQSAGGGGYAPMEEESDASEVAAASSTSALGCSGRAASEISCDQPAGHVSDIAILVCERPDGSAVSPWKELLAFVDSLFQSGTDLPDVFHIDPLGYTVEQDGIPRVHLGVVDSAVVPMTVRVMLR